MPVVVLNFTVEDKFYDINVSPDKREVFLKNEAEIVKELKIKLNEFFEDIQKSKLVQNLKKKEDGYNPTLNQQDNETLQALQKKKLTFTNDKMSESEELEFSKRKESGAHKQMNDLRGRFNSYKDSLKMKRKESELNSSSMGSQSKASQESYRVKRVKSNYERQIEEGEIDEEEDENASQSDKDDEGKDEEMDDEQKDEEMEDANKESEQSESSQDAAPLNVNKSIESIAKRNQELQKQLNNKSKGTFADKIANQRKSKDYLSMFKSKSRQLQKQKVHQARVEAKPVEQAPQDFDSAINRTFGPAKVEHVDKENDPAYELNQDLLDYDQDKLKAFKRQKIQLVNNTLNLDQNLQQCDEKMEIFDITKTGIEKMTINDVHPMDSDKLVFMDKMPVTTNFDRSDVEISLDITSLPKKINREKLRYEIIEQRIKLAQDKINSDKQKTSKFDSGQMDDNILDIDEKKLEEMFDKEDFKKLKIIGQFNLGFILAVRTDTNQLFIMDQHATAEKCKFEELSRTTVIH